MDREIKTYEVTLTFKHPSWDEKDGIQYEIDARSKGDAIKRARRQAYDDGHTVGLRVTEFSFRAVDKSEEAS